MTTYPWFQRWDYGSASYDVVPDPNVPGTWTYRRCIPPS